MLSSVIDHFDYRAAQSALDVTFVSGRRYRYFRVPPSVVERFTRAGSKGHFFNTRIRSRYAFKELVSLRA